MQKLLTVIGARPQFIKASVVSKAIKEQSGIEEIILHTGQHFDTNMSKVFFNQLSLPEPHFQLNIHGGSHGEMTGRMLTEIEQTLLLEKPDKVIVYGDTNSTLAGALAATKLHIPVAHIEAGLRSFNMQMPEEVNRILTDQISDILFCPTNTAIINLQREGFEHKPVGIHHVGDVMLDAALFFAQHAISPTSIHNLSNFIIATLHRAENTDCYTRMVEITSALNEIHNSVAPVILPLHPRTQKLIAKYELKLDVITIDPVGYLEMIWLLQHAGLVITDSGGIQKEAFFFGKQCITMRDQTEWVELVELGVNKLVGADSQKIKVAAQQHYGKAVKCNHELYGGGRTSVRIASILQGS